MCIQSTIDSYFSYPKCVSNFVLGIVIQFVDTIINNSKWLSSNTIGLWGNKCPTGTEIEK